MRKIKLLTLLAALVCATSIWATDEVLSGLFSVSPTKKVQFTRGLLQFNAAQGTHTASDGSTQQGTWQIAANQYDVIGSDNGNISSSYDGWIDLFSWGTSGYNGYNPWMTSSNSNDYPQDLTLGDYYDWGKYNFPGTGYYVLSHDEWNYLINSRANASSKWGAATVAGVYGMILLPDDWSGAAITTYVAYSDQAKPSSNVYDASQWATMEANGAIFLPITGYRGGTTYTLDYSGYRMHYSHCSDAPYASNSYVMGFEWSSSTSRLAWIWQNGISSYGKQRAYSVRLVKVPDFNIAANEDPQNPGTYYSTFYDGSSRYVMPADVEAYTAVIEGDALKLTKIAGEGEAIPTATAVILKSTIQNYSIQTTFADPVTVDENNLQGTDVALTNPNYGRVYVLSGEDGAVGFYKLADGVSIPAHKAYVTLPAASAGAPKRLRFVFNAPTGVESIQNSAISSQKVLRDGQLIIIRNGVEYNANGQIVK